MTSPALQLVLLDLVGTARSPDLSGLGADDWAALNAMASQHRLLPLLHVQHGRNPGVPASIADDWGHAFRYHAMMAMRQQADLATVMATLRDGGFAPLALKGAWLTRFAYPNAAMRPMRDLDLLLDADTVIPAFQLLEANGYRSSASAELALEDAIRLEKHLPPLQSPSGTWIELHHRLWEPDGRMDHATPLAIDAAVRRAAITEADGVAYPAPIDMLAHLIAHAIYSHRLDCGPLLLADIDFLLRHRTIDWGLFWQRAAREGWRDGARLVLELVKRYRPEASAIVFGTDAGTATPPDILDAAPQLMLQDLATRRSAGVLASVRKQGLQGLVNRLLGRRSERSGHAVQHDMAADGGFFGWAGSRMRRTLTDAAQSDVRDQAKAMAQLSAWLDQPR